MRKEWIGGMTALLFLVTAGVDPAAAAGITTRVMVRAFSRDALLITDLVGGARITIRDVTTGTVLAQGIQKGGFGNKELIMIRPRERGVTVFGTPGTARSRTRVKPAGPPSPDRRAPGREGGSPSLVASA